MDPSPTLPTDTPTAVGSAADYKLLRDQVDQLQLDIAGRKAPWFRQLSIWLSLLAFGFSIFTYLNAERQKSLAEIRENQAAFRAQIIKLIELRDEFNRVITKITDPTALEHASSLLNNKVQIHLGAASALADVLGPANVAPIEYGVLAMEQLAQNDYAKAREYHERAVSVARTDGQRARALREHAIFYANAPAGLRDLDRAGDYFKQSLELTRKTPGDYSHYLVGLTYESWGWAEFLAQENGNGTAHFTQARQSYEQIHPRNNLRQWAINALDKKMSSSQPPSTAVPAP